MAPPEDEIPTQKAQGQVEPEAPAPTPTPTPTHKIVEVTCGKCHSGFALPVENSVTGFEFDCTNCGAHNTVTDVAVP